MGVEGMLTEELEELRRVRDELRLRIHLGKAEAKDLWEKSEAKLQELEAKLRSIADQAEEPLQDVGDAARLLLAEIKEGYHRIRAAL